jgi:nucleoside-diphosphate-sugar epimerase
MATRPPGASGKGVRMRFFVTGATGFVGGHVVRQLLAGGHEVSTIVRDPARAGRLKEQGVAVHRGDVTDRASLRTPMEGVDGVFHIAGWYKVGVRDKRDGMRVNVDGTRNVLETMRDLAIPKGVYTSTLAIFSDTHGAVVDEGYRFTGRHLSEYDRTKAVAHYDVAESLIAAGLPLVIVQPGVVYGPGDTSAIGQLLRRYLRRKLPAIPRGSAYCWGYVDDIARGHLLAMERGTPGESYIIAGPPHTLTEALAIAQDITGIPAPRLRLPAGALRLAAGAAGLIERVVPLPPDYASEYLRTSAGVTYLGSNRKARAELGYAPCSLEEGLRETLPAEMRALGLTAPLLT